MQPLSNLGHRGFIFILSFVCCFPSLQSQEFFSSKSFSVAASYGSGKIQFYFQHRPVYILAADEEAVEYSPSWNIQLDKCFYLNKLLDFSLGLSYLTLTEKSEHTATPNWFSFSSDFQAQGFFHVIPELKVKLPTDRFMFNLGLRMGTASFIGDTKARGSSNSLGELHADFSLEIGFALKLSNKFSLECSWVQGLSKYEYIIPTGGGIPIYFKYHSWLAGVRYVLKTNAYE